MNLYNEKKSPNNFLFFWIMAQSVYFYNQSNNQPINQSNKQSIVYSIQGCVLWGMSGGGYPALSQTIRWSSEGHIYWQKISFLHFCTYPSISSLQNTTLDQSITSHIVPGTGLISQYTYYHHLILLPPPPPMMLSRLLAPPHLEEAVVTTDDVGDDGGMATFRRLRLTVLVLVEASECVGLLPPPPKPGVRPLPLVLI